MNGKLLCLRMSLEKFPLMMVLVGTGIGPLPFSLFV